jgi:hypothetical protein
MAVAITVAGCGTGGGKPSGVASLAGANSGSGGGATTTTVPKGNATQLYARWADCMRQHGVQMADPVIGDKGMVSISASKADMASFQAAQGACKALEEAARTAAGGGKRPEKPDPAKMLKFAKCMRAHGLPDFPDPGANGGLQISNRAGSSSDLNPESPTFQKAQNACQPILGNLKGGQRIQVGGGPGAAPGGGGGLSTSGGGK